MPTAGQLATRFLRFLALHHNDTAGHCLRVSRIATRLAVQCRLSWLQEDLKALTLGAALHDLGKIGVPISILDKAETLSKEEWATIRRHPLHSAELLRGFPALEPCIPTVLHHHERWGGGGYPDGLRWEAIPLGARIVAVADSYDAMISNRPYKIGFSHDRAVELLQIASGTQFDPDLVKAFASIPKEDLNG